MDFVAIVYPDGQNHSGKALARGWVEADGECEA